MRRDDSIRYSQHDSSDSSDMNRRIYVHIFVCSEYIYANISHQSPQLIVVCHVRGKCCKYCCCCCCCCCKDKSRSSERHLYCLSTSSLGTSPAPLFSLPPSLFSPLSSCVCECVYYYYYAQLCTRLQLLIIIMNPRCLPFPHSLLLSRNRRLFIYCCYQQILAMWKCYK